MVTVDVPGVVLAIEVREHQAVRAGEQVAVLESMKMEIPVLVEHDGVIDLVNAAVGDALAAGDTVVSMTCCGTEPRLKTELGS